MEQTAEQMHIMNAWPFVAAFGGFLAHDRLRRHRLVEAARSAADKRKSQGARSVASAVTRPPPRVRTSGSDVGSAVLVDSPAKLQPKRKSDAAEPGRKAKRRAGDNFTCPTCGKSSEDQSSFRSTNWSRHVREESSGFDAHVS